MRSCAPQPRVEKCVARGVLRLATGYLAGDVVLGLRRVDSVDGTGRGGGCG